MTQISISLPESLVEKIDRMAQTENRNRSNFIATHLERMAVESLVMKVAEPAEAFGDKNKR